MFFWLEATDGKKGKKIILIHSSWGITGGTD